MQAKRQDQKFNQFSASLAERQRLSNSAVGFVEQETSPQLK
jgi:hypothetical protein